MKRRTWLAIAVAIGAAAFVTLLWKGPWWADGAHLTSDLTPGAGAVVTGFRNAVVAVGVGTVAGIGLYYTDRNLRHTRELFEHTRAKDREEAELVREGQMTDRYAAAIELLAAHELTKRLGGIYALERIMRDSAKDHATVVEVLAAFVREHAAYSELEEDDVSEPERFTFPPSRHLDEHVSAALTVIMRRPTRDEPFSINLRRIDLSNVDLSESNLRRVNLSGSNLSKSFLVKSDLTEADLSRCRLDGAFFAASSMEGAQLYRSTVANVDMTFANLKGANLNGLNLQGVQFREADMRGAHLSSSSLRDASLEDADLRDATGMTVEQLLDASDLRGVKLSPEYTRDQRVHRRVNSQQA